MKILNPIRPKSPFHLNYPQTCKISCFLLIFQFYFFERINLIGEDFVNDRDTFEDGNLTNNWYIKQNLAELSCGVFNIIGLGIGFLAYDIENDLVNIYDPKTQASIGPDLALSVKTYLYWLLLFSTICLCNFFLFL